MKFRDFLEEQLKDPEFRKIYERDKIKYDIISQTIAERNRQNLTQKDLADRMETKQASVSRFENGNVNPSLDFLIKLAESLGKKLEVKFV
ncbi:MAG: helix-turn-helix transcriptional regulator [Fusobacterium sp.]|nr:helix-turn-helix transcriptional regulator [Fusobacterium sp.]